MAEVPLVEPVGLVGPPAHLIGAAVDDLAVQPFHVVAVLDESVRQVIEQLGIARRIGEAQIVGRIDDPRR